METRALILNGWDWQGLYINGVLVWEDNSLDDPDTWVRLTNKYGITKLETKPLEEVDRLDLDDTGNLPLNIEDLKFNY